MYFKPTYFVFGFLIGIILVTLIAEQPIIVVKYPTPYNTKKITYVDHVGNCYQYQANKVVCPVDNKLIHEYLFKFYVNYKRCNKKEQLKTYQ